VRLAGAEVIDRYAGGVLDGSPAITRHVHGDGVAWYVSTQLEDDAYRTLVRQVIRGAGIELPDLPGGVELVRRRRGENCWSFLINHGAAGVEVPMAGHDLLSGTDVLGVVALPAGGQAVVRS